MKTDETGFLFYFLIGIIYAIFFGLLGFVFNIFSDVKTPVITIVFQSIFFGIFMSLFDFWLYKRKNRKK